MRIGEAIRLDRSDIDYDHGLIVVRDSKFGRSRELALDPTTIAALRRYCVAVTARPLSNRPPRCSRPPRGQG
jgi:integrase